MSCSFESVRQSSAKLILLESELRLTGSIQEEIVRVKISIS